MLKRIVLPTIFIVLTYGFWVSPDFKEIAAGVAIFLFGMLFLEEGFKAFTGGLLDELLKRSTTGAWRSLGFGIVTTTIMQSSSLVSVITISFLSAGLIDLAGGIGIIFGANIGTTTGAWLVAGLGLKVKISAYAMPMLVFGIILVLQSSKKLRGVGYILAGLGFLFLGIHYMKEGFEAFRGSFDLSAYSVGGYPGLFIYTGIGLAATVIMQSSHATLVLIITALASQQISYENGLALAIGANIGTTITAVLGALSANYQGRRLAGAHLIFNVLTGLIAIVFIYQLMAAVDGISQFVGIRHDDYTLKLAVFHTVFNVIGVSVVAPFTGKLVRFLERTIPQTKLVTTEPKFLNDAIVDFPETLVEAVRNESVHLYDSSLEIIAHGLSMHRHHILSDRDLATLVRNDRRVMAFDLDTAYVTKVKSLYAAIIDFVSRVRYESEAQNTDTLFELRMACGYIVQAVKDVKHLRKNMSIYISSNNESIREQYNVLRVEIGMLLRMIDALRNGDDETVSLLDLDDFKVQIEEGNAAVDGTLDRLIRKGKITATMGTSLMNDIGYVRKVIWSLADVAIVLFGSRDVNEHAVELLLSLDEEEIEDMAASKRGLEEASR
jgi:phosphate:Na+ symporter